MGQKGKWINERRLSKDKLSDPPGANPDGATRNAIQRDERRVWDEPSAPSPHANGMDGESPGWSVAQPRENRPLSHPPQRGGRRNRPLMALSPCGRSARPVGARIVCRIRSQGCTLGFHRWPR